MQSLPADAHRKEWAESTKVVSLTTLRIGLGEVSEEIEVRENFNTVMVMLFTNPNSADEARAASTFTLETGQLCYIPSSTITRVTEHADT